MWALCTTKPSLSTSHARWPCCRKRIRFHPLNENEWLSRSPAAGPVKQRAGWNSTAGFYYYCHYYQHGGASPAISSLCLAYKAKPENLANDGHSSWKKEDEGQGTKQNENERLRAKRRGWAHGARSVVHVSGRTGRI